jgi:hypothetical protein
LPTTRPESSHSLPTPFKFLWKRPALPLECDMQQAAHPNITQPSSRLYLKVGILCALAVMMDGFDAQATGFVAPALLAEWHITRLALSPILSSGLVGMLAGALLFGPIGDRLGRRRVLVLCTLWFAFGSLLTARAHTVETMLWLRLATGFGLGGAMPNATALTAEYMPRRLRATGVMLMFCGSSMGAAIGGFVAAGIINRYGWPAVVLQLGHAPRVLSSGRACRDRGRLGVCPEPKPQPRSARSPARDSHARTRTILSLLPALLRNHKWPTTGNSEFCPFWCECCRWRLHKIKMCVSRNPRRTNTFTDCRAEPKDLRARAQIGPVKPKITGQTV